MSVNNIYVIIHFPNFFILKEILLYQKQPFNGALQNGCFGELTEPFESMCL